MSLELRKIPKFQLHVYLQFPLHAPIEMKYGVQNYHNNIYCKLILGTIGQEGGISISQTSLVQLKSSYFANYKVDLISILV